MSVDRPPIVTCTLYQARHSYIDSALHAICHSLDRSHNSKKNPVDKPSRSNLTVALNFPDTGLFLGWHGLLFFTSQESQRRPHHICPLKTLLRDSEVVHRDLNSLCVHGGPPLLWSGESYGMDRTGLLFHITKLQGCALFFHEIWPLEFFRLLWLRFVKWSDFRTKDPLSYDVLSLYCVFYCVNKVEGM